MSVSIDKMEGQHGNITTSTYECSNRDCFVESQREIEQMKKKKEERDVLHKKRIATMQENRKKTRAKSK